jgi:mannose-1-phosphate guanylyltransferase / mannose-6-phosphate isomerase
MKYGHSMLIPVILSGGTGTRLWPVSRESHPKPFIKLADGLSLLQKTYLRAAALENVKEILTITNREYFLKTQEEYLTICKTDHHTHSFILEPFARNTAPAILMAALKIYATHGPNAVLLVMPADHLTENQAAFAHALKSAVNLANEHLLVTFGVKPTEPEIAFGYIECGAPYLATDCFKVARFVEKPDLPTAQTYVLSPHYLWNSGIFCFKASVLIEQFQQHDPNLLAKAQECWQKSRHPEALITELDAESFSKLPTISIDYALMENSQDIAVVSAHFKWNDIGSWDRIIKLFNSDPKGNITVGDTVMVDSNDNFIYGENRMIASVGIHNLVVIDTPDALLIADRNRTQEVKEVVQQLKNKSHESYKHHRTAVRPWGSYTVLEEGANFKIKRIVVKPGASLSLQIHKHRSEHWVVVSGTAKVINGEQECLLQTNESTYILPGNKHRLENPGMDDLIIIEVQTGKYLGEDDIVRIEDKYGRVTLETPA